MERRQRVPAKVKAIAVVLYFNGMSFRKVSEVLRHVMGVKVSPEAIRLWWHLLAKFLRTLYTLAMFVYMDETKIKARNKRYILWVATTRDGKPTFVWLSNRRNSHVAKLVLYSFPHNAKYETVWSWIADFFFIKSFISPKSELGILVILIFSPKKPFWLSVGKLLSLSLFINENAKFRVWRRRI